MIENSKVSHGSYIQIFLAFFILIIGYQSALAAPKPKQLILAIGGENNAGYDPTLGWGRYGSPLFQSTLLARDENYEIVSDLAEKYSLSDDRLVWHFTLRKDAVFSDGHPVNAEDVVYTFQTTAKTAGLVDLSNMESVLAKGPYEVEIRLKKPEITFAKYLWRLGIVPKHLHGADYARNPIGSGPYTFIEWHEGQQLIVRANAKYYGRKPQFEELVFLFMAEDTAFAAAKAGQVHVVAVPQSLAKQSISGMKLHSVPSVDNRGIMFPMLPVTGKKSTTGVPIGNDVTSDLAIRQAINYALDRQALVDGILYGFGSPAYGLVDGLPWDEPSIRFKDKFDYEIEVEESILQYKIPKMLLQPLVENAIIHGVNSIPVKGHIKIYGKKNADYIIFEIFDTGLGFNEDILIKIESKINFGINYVIQRLSEYNDNKCRFTAKNLPGGGAVVSVTIKIIDGYKNE